MSRAHAHTRSEQKIADHWNTISVNLELSFGCCSQNFLDKKVFHYLGPHDAKHKKSVEEEGEKKEKANKLFGLNQF